MTISTSQDPSITEAKQEAKQQCMGSRSSGQSLGCSFQEQLEYGLHRGHLGRLLIGVYRDARRTLRGPTPLEGTGAFFLATEKIVGVPDRRGIQKKRWCVDFTCLYFSDHHGPGQPSWLSELVELEEEQTGHEDTLMTKQPLSAHCGDRQDLAPWAL